MANSTFTNELSVQSLLDTLNQVRLNTDRDRILWDAMQNQIVSPTLLAPGEVLVPPSILEFQDHVADSVRYTVPTAHPEATRTIPLAPEVVEANVRAIVSLLGGGELLHDRRELAERTRTRQSITVEGLLFGGKLKIRLEFDQRE